MPERAGFGCPFEESILGRNNHFSGTLKANGPAFLQRGDRTTHGPDRPTKVVAMSARVVEIKYRANVSARDRRMDGNTILKPGSMRPLIEINARCRARDNM